LQVKLLRVLQENEIRPVGESKATQIDVRVIAATAKNLQEEVKKGTFREDLYYRLNVLTIQLPPLRERSEDIPLLCEHFIRRFNKRLGKSIQGISSAAMTTLLEYQWPGNVRELENVIERGVVLGEGAQLRPEHLPPELLNQHMAEPVDTILSGYSIKSAQKLMEKTMITRALEKTGGNRTQAARLLEISHPSLLTKIKAYDIPL
jgi:two-component system response regulator AtoC